RPPGRRGPGRPPARPLLTRRAHFARVRGNLQEVRGKRAAISWGVRVARKRRLPYGGSQSSVEPFPPALISRLDTKETHGPPPPGNGRPPAPRGVRSRPAATPGRRHRGPRGGAPPRYPRDGARA